jgi:ABC-type multidrug transport system ATPase subunit
VLFRSELSLQVEPGEVVGIVGPSGGGKSSLARLICGELAPARGTVRLGGQPLQGRPTPAQVQRLFQAPAAHLPPHLTVAAALGETVAVHGGAERVEGVLKRLGLWERRSAPTAQLSGGERRRAGIARLALTRPELLILDEPTAGLDAHRAVEAMELLMDERRADGAVLVITHDLRLVRAFADRLAVISQGRTIEECASAALGHTTHHPRTTALLHPEGPVQPVSGAGCPHTSWCPLTQLPECTSQPPRLRAPPSDQRGSHRLACHVLAPPESP